MQAFSKSRIFRALAVVFFGSALWAGAANADCILDMSGAVTYNIDSGQVSVSVATIYNTGCEKAFTPEDGYTAPVGVSLWATTAPYTGDSDITGYVLFSETAGTLNEAQLVTGFLKSATYDPPPSGTYYLTIVLSELSSTGLMPQGSMRDYHAFAEPKALGSEDDQATATEEAAYNPLPRETYGTNVLKTNESDGDSGGCFIKALLP